MNSCSRNYLFTSESVTEGHPDKIADQISDAVLDALLAQDPTSRVACETLLTTGLAIVAGEITTKGYVEIPDIVRQTIKEIGYTRAKYGFDYETCGVITSVHSQSPDIAMGVDTGGAGDQGLMFGYACDETPELMPMTIMLAHKLTRQLSEMRKSEVLPYLRPDGKSQVTIEYRDGKPYRIHTIVVSSQHSPDVALEEPARGHHREGDQAGGPEEPPRRGDDRIPHQPHRKVRNGRTHGRHRPYGPQDYRGHLRRCGQPRRRMFLGQGPDEG